MSDDVWRPFGSEGSEKQYDALAEHIPAYLRPSLVEWLLNHVARSIDQSGRWPTLNPQKVSLLERVTRLSLRDESGAVTAGHFLALLDDDQVLLTLLDGVLATMTSPEASRYAMDLHERLRVGGSAYEVGLRAGKPALVRRVDGTTQGAAEAAMSGTGTPAHHLRIAWGEAFGREPNPSEAYRHAIKAIEAATHPIVIPNDSLPTLGKVIAALVQRDKFVIGLPVHDKNDPHKTLIDMLGLAWHGQYDRHGSADLTKPLSVTQVEAEAVVLLAVTLVHWMNMGLLQRVPDQ